jgi:hypothetical protein
MALTKVSKGLISTDTVFEVDAVGGKYGSSSAPITIAVTVGTKTAAHPYNGDGSSSAYFLDGLEAPAIYLNGADNVTSDSGYYYKFDQSDSTNSTHPLRFYLDADKTTAYTTGVTTSGTPGSSGAYTQIDVDEDTPSILYYQCSSHSYMGNYALVPASNVINHTEALISMPTATTTLVGTDTTDTLSNKTLTEPKIADGGFIADANGNELIKMQTTSSAVNELEVTNAATGNAVVVGASGGDTNIDIDITPKGTGEVNIAAGNLNYAGTAVTATGAEINYLDITTLGASEASKVLTANASGIVTFNKAITEQSVSLTSGTSVTLDISQGSVFTITLAHNISTFTWSNPATSGDVSAFVLKVTQDGTGSRTIAFPAAVDFAGGTAPTLSTGANDVDVFVFFTVDAGTNYFGFTAGLDMT